MLRKFSKPTLTVFLLTLACFVSAAQAEVKAVFTDTYLTRLLNTDPEKYNNCLAKGPTTENIEGKLCARATRHMLSCAAKKAEIHCGRYAFTYARGAVVWSDTGW